MTISTYAATSTVVAVSILAPSIIIWRTHVLPRWLCILAAVEIALNAVEPPVWPLDTACSLGQPASAPLSTSCGSRPPASAWLCEPAPSQPLRNHRRRPDRDPLSEAIASWGNPSASLRTASPHGSSGCGAQLGSALDGGLGVARFDLSARPCDVSGHRHSPDLRFVGLGLFLFRGGSGWLARLVVAAGVDDQLAEEFSSGLVHDPDVEVLNEQNDVGSGVGSPDLDVVHLAGDAEGDGAAEVDLVVADAVMCVGAAIGGRGGFRAGLGRWLRGSLSVAGSGGARRWLYSSMKASSWFCSWAMVAGWRGWVRSHFFRVCWKRSTFPQVVGWLGLPVFCKRCCGRAARVEVVATALAAGEPGGEHHAVVGERRGRVSVQVSGLAKHSQHDGAGDPRVGGAGQHVAGVVIDRGQDLNVDARGALGCGKSVVGEVRLPGLVGLCCLEAQVGGPGSFRRLGDHSAVAGQDSVDSGPRQLGAVVVAQVPPDGVRARVQTGTGKLLAQLKDQVDSRGRSGAWGGSRSPGPGLGRPPRPRSCSAPSSD